MFGRYGSIFELRDCDAVHPLDFFFFFPSLKTVFHLLGERLC